MTLRSALLCLLLAAPAAHACDGRLRIEIPEAGVYGLDQASIAAAQPALADCPSDALVLTWRGKEVPVRVVDGGDGRFGAGDRIEWLGEPLHGPESWFDPYSTVNAYVLAAAPGKAHARLADVVPGGPAAPAPLERRLHLEQDNLMIRLNQQLVKLWEEPDYWHWAKLTQVDPEPFAFEFDLPDLAAKPGRIEADIALRGLSEIPPQPGQAGPRPADHRIELSLNGQPAGAVEWSGRAEETHRIALPAGALRERGNRLELRVPKRFPPNDPRNALVDVVMFNFVEFAYPLRGTAGTEPLTTAGSGAPVLALTGEAPALYGSDGHRYLAQPAGTGRARYVALPSGVTLYPLADTGELRRPSRLRAINPVDWHHPAQAYDYLVIAHPRLIAAIQPLAEFHRQRGLKVAVLDVEDVYDQFNDGIVHPSAIRALAASAYKDWSTPRPRYILLVGDASFDIRHQKIDRLKIAKWADRELLEPGHFGDIPSTPYADTPADLPNRNLIPTWQFPSYDGQSASDNHFVSVGKHELHPVIAIGRLPVVEPAEVTAIVQKTIDYLRTPQFGAWRRDVMFIADETDYFKQSSDRIAESLGSQGFVSDKVYASPEEADNLAHQADIKKGLNEGRLLVHFIGHGGRYIWRTGPPDLRKNHDLFTLDDVSNLQNGGRLPLVLSMTCYSAPFDNPTEDSIGERFLREPGKGAVAVFAASWRNSPSPEYSKALIEQLTTPGTTVGQAIVAAKTKMLDATLIETYNLLGDPALILERPAGGVTLHRDTGLSHATRTEARIDGPGFHGTVHAAWVDADSRVIATRTFTAQGKRFVIPDLGAEVARAQVLNVYVADPDRAFDAIGSLRLAAPELAKPVATTTAQPAAATAPAPAAPASNVATAAAATAAPPTAPAATVKPPPSGPQPDAIQRNGFEEAPPSKPAGKRR